MSRAGQTPHGARPNREEVPDFGRGHVPARCVKPPGRSLEPRSDARPRGMAVPQEQSRGQNSAYRSGCQVHAVATNPMAHSLSQAKNYIHKTLWKAVDPEPSEKQKQCLWA